MTTPVTSQEHLVGLLLGAEEDWPTAFEALARRLGVLRDAEGRSHSLRTERVTIEPFNLRDKARQELVIDRLALLVLPPARVAEEGRADGRRLPAELARSRSSRWRSTRRTAP